MSGDESSEAPEASEVMKPLLELYYGALEDVREVNYTPNSFYGGSDAKIKVYFKHKNTVTAMFKRLIHLTNGAFGEESELETMFPWEGEWGNTEFKRRSPTNAPVKRRASAPQKRRSRSRRK